MLYRIASLVLGYILAAMFSASVSMTLSLTVWGSIWTYAILVFWWAVGHFLLVPMIFVSILGIGAAGLGTLRGGTWLIDKIRGR